jgi:predicted nucleotidyltransferase component of viral defense system
MLLSYRDIAKHQAVVPWKRERQVEQDLLLCLAMQAIFTDGFLSGQVSMRGGTLLHKVHLAPAARYSEDIDLVVHGDRPEGHIEKALRRVLLPVLGKPVGFGWESVKLAIRNAVQPSRVLRLSYSVPNVSGDGPELDIVVEANVTERVSYLPVVRVPYAFEFRGERVEFAVNGYETHEMLGTKMRALFQRRRGRDLFDLYWALEHSREALNPEQVKECFLFYLQKEGGAAGRKEFLEILDGHLLDRGFCSDMEPLLRMGIDYDPQAAGSLVKERLLAILPEYSAKG